MKAPAFGLTCLLMFLGVFNIQRGFAQRPVPVVSFADDGELLERCSLDDNTQESTRVDLQTHTARPCQLNAALKYIELEKSDFATQQTIVITFVHGWLHDGDQDDPNRVSFEKKISDLNICKESDKSKCIHYAGVYISWRGKTVGGPLTYLSFFGREKGAERVAGLSLTESILRLRNATWASPGTSKFFIFGHSFGGLIVQQVTAGIMAGSLLSSDKISCADGTKGDKPIADLIVLINPAADSILTQQLIDLMKRSDTTACRVPGLSDDVKTPLIISIHSRSDGDTGKVFVASHWLESFTQHLPDDSEDCLFCKTPVLPGDTPGAVWMGQIGHTTRAKFEATTGQLPFFHNFCYLDQTLVGEQLCAELRDETSENFGPRLYKGETIRAIKQKVIDQFHLPELAHVTGLSAASDILASVKSEPEHAQLKSALVAGLQSHLVFSKAAGTLKEPGLLLNLYCRAESCADERHLWNDTPFWIFNVSDDVISGHSYFWQDNVDFTNLMRNLASGLMFAQAEQPAQVP